MVMAFFVGILLFSLQLLVMFMSILVFKQKFKGMHVILSLMFNIHLFMMKPFESIHFYLLLKRFDIVLMFFILKQIIIDSKKMNYLD